MGCSCTNHDGTLSTRCFGTCKDKIILHVEEQKRDPMGGFAEMIMNQVKTLINHRMTTLKLEFQKEQFDLYNDAFLKGIKEGIRLRDSYGNDFE